MAELKDPTNKAKTDFLFIEAEVGLTFTSIALDTNNANKKNRVTHYARKAYDTAEKLRKKVQMNPTQDGQLTENLLRLKEQLKLLGETF